MDKDELEFKPDGKKCINSLNTGYYSSSTATPTFNGSAALNKSTGNFNSEAAIGKYIRNVICGTVNNVDKMFEHKSKPSSSLMSVLETNMKALDDVITRIEAYREAEADPVAKEYLKTMPERKTPYSLLKQQQEVMEELYAILQKRAFLEETDS